MTTWPVFSTPHAMYLMRMSDVVKVPLQRAASPRGDLHGDDLSVVGDHEALGHVGPPVGPYSGQAPAVTPHLLDIVDIIE